MLPSKVWFYSSQIQWETLFFWVLKMCLIQSASKTLVYGNDYFLFANHNDWPSWWYLNSLSFNSIHFSYLWVRTWNNQHCMLDAVNKDTSPNWGCGWRWSHVIKFWPTIYWTTHCLGNFSYNAYFCWLSMYTNMCPCIIHPWVFLSVIIFELRVAMHYRWRSTI